ncbi:MAG: cysteine desulfurase [Methyloligellaceae bacterium]
MDARNKKAEQNVARGRSSDYDVARIRADFPILSRTIYDKPLVYMDNGASAQKPRVVLEAIRKSYEEEYSNVHRGLHFLSNTATANYEAARQAAANFINAPGVDEIIFTSNATAAINLVAQSFGSIQIQEGDEIVLSIMEHHSNIVPWHFHRERRGANLVWVPVEDDGSFSLEAFEKSLTDRTKMVAITHVSNVLGTIVPIKKIADICRGRNIPVLVDGSQGAVHEPVDVQVLGVDFYIFTGHKVYGPSGIGVLWAKMEHLEAMPPFMGGGEMIGEVHKDKVTYAAPPHRFEAGTPPIVQAIGLGAALTYMQSIGVENIKRHERDLAEYAQKSLKKINSLRIIGEAPGKASIISFEMQGVHPHDISTIIDRSGVAVRAGTHCAEPLLQRFGVTSTCRASLGMYNTREEIDILVEALLKAEDFFT